jgi:predicted metal-dependent HD superfamily phosphohydrolase
MEKARWLRMMSALRLPAEEDSYAALLSAYSEKHRHYHTVEHIDHCLHELDREIALATEPAEVELAIWFHDVVYNPHRSDNEEKSAELACGLLQRHRVDSERVARVHAHIMATRHEAPVTMPDSQLVVDIDLSILGASEEAYARFEENVRKEYCWVPSIIFRRKRAEILQSFLDRAAIYSTEPFRTRYEAQARRNLEYAIAAMRIGSSSEFRNA